MNEIEQLSQLFNGLSELRNNLSKCLQSLDSCLGVTSKEVAPKVEPKVSTHQKLRFIGRPKAGDIKKVKGVEFRDFLNKQIKISGSIVELANDLNVNPTLINYYRHNDQDVLNIRVQILNVMRDKLGFVPGILE